MSPLPSPKPSTRSLGSDNQWQGRTANLQTQTHRINQIQTDVSALETSLNALGDPLGALASMNATSSDTSVVDASAAAGTAAGTSRRDRQQYRFNRILVFRLGCQQQHRTAVRQLHHSGWLRDGDTINDRQRREHP